MKTKNVLFPVLFLTVTGLSCFRAEAQSVKYTYDGAGNRILREKVIPMSSMMKSASVADNAGTKETERMQPEETVKYEETLAEAKIVIYPNPTKGQLRVEITGRTVPPDAKIQLYNMTGALTRQWNTVSDSNALDISAQPAGTYIMRIILDKQNVSSWKIVKD
jgi:hypothetical protein